jgi:hypothetical protein
MVMKNVHLIPTFKPSRLYKSKITQDISMGPIDIYQHGDATYNLTIYITSDEKPKAGDWSLYQNKIHKCIEDIIGDEFKKIILTTDQDLINDGVQAIDDEFLHWFVKNLSCEYVEVKQELGLCLNCEWNYDSCPNTEECLKDNYKIIIPQEEPKSSCPKCRTTDFDNCHSIQCPMREEPKQETLEEAAERLYPFAFGGIGNSENDKKNHFVKGAEWQSERTYSEEEVIDLLQEMNDWPTIFDGRIDIKEWFEQFKKK